MVKYHIEFYVVFFLLPEIFARDRQHTATDGSY